MKRKNLLFLLLALLFVPWAAKAQSTLTVYENTTTTSYYVPMFVYYFDDFTRAQTVFPAEDLSDMACGTITAITFYTTSYNIPYTTLSSADIYLTEVASTTISAYVDKSSATTVCTGYYDFVSDGEGGGIVTITLATPYQYNGGNLLFGCDNTEDTGYKQMNFKGITATGASISGYSSSATGTISANQRNFLPKTTFTYTPSPYAAPASIGYTNNAPGNTTVSWTAPTTTETVTGYAYRYKKTSITEWPAFETVSATTLSTTLTLDPETGYDFEVKTIYGENESCSTKKVSFTTLSSCMTPEDLTITNVTWNSATFNWTEGFGNGEWKLGYKKSGENTYTLIDVVAADLPITLDVFEEQTEYDVVVYPLCDDTKTLEDSFTTKCEPITETSWEENFESYSAGIFSADCWENVRIVDGTGSGSLSSFSIYTYTTGSNSTKQLYLPDMKAGSMTKLCLRGFEIPVGANYQFSLDVYRNANYSNYGEGIRVFASTNGEIEGATELAFISRSYTTAYTIGGNVIIPAESTSGWYSYEIPIPFDGLCYIILRGESQYGSSTYMDNFAIEPVPTCGRPGTPMVAPNTLTNHSVKLTWTAPEGQEAWQIAYKQSNTDFDPTDSGSGATIIDVTTNPYLFDKTLEAGKKYYVYVRGNCGNDGYSKWCKTACSFTTKEATPKPTAVTVTNIGSTTADLYWTKGGGDFETSWDVYRVASETTPTTTPDANTEPTFTVNTLPTSEAPYEMTNLTPETKYYLWVRANHGNDGYSVWQAMSGGSFTTQVACPKPTNVAANNITHTTADLTWTGYSDSYTVEYQTAAYEESIFFDGFENGFDDQGWTIYTEGDAISGEAGWVIYDSPHSGDYCASAWSYYGSNLNADNWLITPQVDLQGTLKFWEKAYSYSWPDAFEVKLSTSGKAIADFTVTLREMQASSSNWNEVAIDLSSYSGQGYIAIHHVDIGQYALFIDDFGIYGNEIPAGGWAEATTTATDGAYPLDGLTAGTKYDVRVKGNCGGEYSDVYTFTTLDENTKFFTTAGNWNVAGNWTPEGAPTIEQKAIIKADVIIPSGYTATAKSVTIQGTPAPTITIKDGGQLIHYNDGVVATVEKNILGYTGTKDRYYLLTAPVYDDMDPTTVTNMLSNNYDLYAFDGTNDGEEWINYEDATDGGYDMEMGYAYLYANSENVTLSFTGELFPIPQSGYVSFITGNYLDYTTESHPFANWQLVGNPHPCDAYIVMCDYDNNLTLVSNYSDFYKINPETNEVVAATGAVAPMEGVFVKSLASTNIVVSSATALRGSYMNLNLSQSNGIIDVARIRFDKGEGMEKIQLNPNHTKLYIPQDDKDYAVVYSEEKAGEMPVSFKAEKNGSYTLSFNTENVEFGYLHLIDNLTGNDVDLLANPSYSFEAKTTDYASRFKLVFAAGSNANDESFAFMSDGNLIVNNEGEATLQVIDVNGRILRSERINGSASINMNTVPGVYMIRVINGENVKTQKMVVR